MRLQCLRPVQWNIGAMLVSCSLIIAGTASNVSGRAAQVSRDGPWAFTEQLAPNTNNRLFMATTPSIQDSDVWLVLGCSGFSLTASLAHNTRFPYAAYRIVNLTLRADDLPVVEVVAQRIQANLYSINPTLSRHIASMIIDSRTIAIVVKDHSGDTHSYEFSLQPSAIALDGIVQHCLRLP